MRPLFQSRETGYALQRRGKVRDVYRFNDQALIIVACDRISAFDRVLPTPILGKGRILTALSNFWFARTAHIIPNHLMDADPSWLEWRSEDPDMYEAMRGRVVLVRKARPLPIEAIVRGHITGSAWKDYRRTGAVCGQPLPPGLRESEAFPAPLFTPSTKAPDGEHDQNIGYDEAVRLLGASLAGRVREASLALYDLAAGHARRNGIILADTKFEFGLIDEQLVLIDEALTPDSSRFWPADGFAPGRSQPSFDKQFVRDHLAGIGWHGEEPAPELPAAIVAGTAERYREALRRLTACGQG